MHQYRLREANRLIRVLKVKCLRSIFWVFLLPISCTFESNIRSYGPQASVKNFVTPYLAIGIPKAFLEKFFGRAIVAIALKVIFLS